MSKMSLLELIGLKKKKGYEFTEQDREKAKQARLLKAGDKPNSESSELAPASLNIFMARLDSIEKNVNELKETLLNENTPQQEQQTYIPQNIGSNNGNVLQDALSQIKAVHALEEELASNFVNEEPEKKEDKLLEMFAPLLVNKLSQPQQVQQAKPQYVEDRW